MAARLPGLTPMHAQATRGVDADLRASPRNEFVQARNHIVADRTTAPPEHMDVLQNDVKLAPPRLHNAKERISCRPDQLSFDTSPIKTPSARRKTATDRR
jgi:hypothetical protein